MRDSGSCRASAKSCHSERSEVTISPFVVSLSPFVVSLSPFVVSLSNHEWAHLVRPSTGSGRTDSKSIPARHLFLQSRVPEERPRHRDVAIELRRARGKAVEIPDL